MQHMPAQQYDQHFSRIQYYTIALQNKTAVTNSFVTLISTILQVDARKKSDSPSSKTIQEVMIHNNCKLLKYSDIIQKRFWVLWFIAGEMSLFIALRGGLKWLPKMLIIIISNNDNWILIQLCTASGVLSLEYSMFR